MLGFLQRSYSRSREQWNGLRAVPIQRLWVLLLGAFLLFFCTGYYVDLLRDGTLPYAAIFAIGSISGLNTVLWILFLRRLSFAFFFVMVGLQFFLGGLSRSAANFLIDHFHLSPVPPVSGIHFAAQGMFWTVVLGYATLLRYIRVGGVDTLVPSQATGTRA